VVTVIRRIRRLCCGWAFAITALAFGACGGPDRGRPKAELATSSLDAGVDTDTECTAAADLTLLSITDFEPAPGSSSGLKPTAVCDPGINANGACSMYYNFDGEQSPHVCTSATPSAASCVQADGTPEPASFCLTTNIRAAGAMVDVTQIPGGRCGVSNYAFHLAATNIAACYDPTTLKQGWGVTYQIAFTFDASSWDGISLWVRRGSASSVSAILVNMQDEYTSGSACGMLAALEPAVPSMPPPPDALKCDPFGLGVGLTDDWRFVKIPFAKAEQKGFGVPSPLGKLDAAGLTGVQFVLSPGDWDLWIDDLAIYREPQ
jgi:hypothetical protein